MLKYTMHYIVVVESYIFIITLEEFHKKFFLLVKIKNICLKSNIYQFSDNITIGLWYLTDRMLLDIEWLVNYLMHIDYKSEVYHIEINGLSAQKLFWVISRTIACWLDILHINYLQLIICVFENFNSLINKIITHKNLAYLFASHQSEKTLLAFSFWKQKRYNTWCVTAYDHMAKITSL